jgi:acyl-CoA synthetase (AMP-forming)/AMP-acid ligase II
MSVTLLQDYPSRRAQIDPSKAALIMGDERVTYGELERDANRLARMLIEHGCGPDDRVCLFTPKSPAAIVAMHAILKAGAAYVPIDPASPAPRIARILDAAEPRLVLAAAAAAPMVDELVAAGQLRSGVGSLGVETSPPRSSKAIGGRCRRTHLRSGAARTRWRTYSSRRGRPGARRES